MGRILIIALVLAAGVDAYKFDGRYAAQFAQLAASILHHFGI
jgi:hypothetical protein